MTMVLKSASTSDQCMVLYTGTRIWSVPWLGCSSQLALVLYRQRRVIAGERCHCLSMSILAFHGNDDVSSGRAILRRFQADVFRH